MRLAAAAAALAVAVCLGSPTAAFADPQGSGSTTVSSGGGAYNVTAKKTQQGSGSPSPSAGAQHEGRWVAVPVCEAGGSATCFASTACPDGSARMERWFQTPAGARLYDTTYCPDGGPDLGQLTPARIAQAFRSIAVPAPPLTLQPHTTTIVNFPTIAYTTAKPFDATVSLLGHQVTFHITPATFTWHWGDRHTTTTHTPGKPYTQDNTNLTDDITHKYEDTDPHDVYVTTTYTATYTLDGTPHGTVDGTVTKDSTHQEIKAKTYTPVLVSR